MENLAKNTNQPRIDISLLHGRIWSKSYYVCFVIDLKISITATVGNGLILYPLYKISSLHPSSKCLFSNLAYTDIRVGLIFQPFHLAYIISQEHSPICYHGSLINRTLGVIFCGVSVLTLTAVSTDRLLAVSLGLRYRQVVTLWRVRVTLVLCWRVCITRGITNNSILPIYLIISNMGVILSMMTSTFCYIAFYIKLHRQQAQLQEQKPTWTT